MIYLSSTLYTYSRHCLCTSNYCTSQGDKAKDLKSWGKGEPIITLLHFTLSNVELVSWDKRRNFSPSSANLLRCLGERAYFSGWNKWHNDFKCDIINCNNFYLMDTQNSYCNMFRRLAKCLGEWAKTAKYWYKRSPDVKDSRKNNSNQ